jgi:RNA polymerase sigma-70 factor (ECF subfamily)
MGEGGGSAEEHVQDGEVNTLVDIYTKHERRIYRYCLALLRNPDDAEDATQETFTRAAPFLPNLAGDLSAYLTTVARNICCDVVRARARRPVSLDKVPLPDRAVSPERQSVDWDVVRRMWRQLTPSERLLFAYTFAGYRYEEIASRTGMSRPSVSVGLTRARRRLRDLATAIGAMGLLPLGLKRLLDRASRRASTALASGQQALLVVAEQAGAIAAGVLAGLVGLATGGAAVAAPAMVAAAHHEPAAATGAASSPAVPPGSSWSSGAGASALPAAAERPGHSAPAAQPLPPAVNQAVSVLPGGDATPWRTSPSAVAVSPNFNRDHTVFLTADVENACAGALCAALFRSDDAGASWTRLWPGTYQGGQVLLPPQFPADPGIFVLRPGTGLLVSAKGDGVFTNAVPGATAVAVAPDSAVGRSRFAVLIGSAVTTYTLDDAAPLPGPALPAGFSATGIAFAGPDRLVVAGWLPSTRGLTSMSQPALVSCPLTGSCGVATAVPDPAAPVVALAPSRAPGAPVVAYTSRRIYLSTDRGATFHPVLTAPAGYVVEIAAVGMTPSGSRVVAALGDTPTLRHTGVRSSDDLGASFVDATGNLNAGGRSVALEVLAGGDMLIGLNADGTANFGLRQSSGGGSWAPPRPF